MGRKSVRENKNIYQRSREAVGLSREAAAELMVFVTADRIEKIEYETSEPRPEEVLAMAECYKAPALCNHYCSHACPIGREYVPEIRLGSLAQITLELLVNLRALDREKDRLAEITVDGRISEDEQADFSRIREMLERMALTIDAMQLWLNQPEQTDG